jgi:hypothetical protein
MEYIQMSNVRAGGRRKYTNEELLAYLESIRIEALNPIVREQSAMVLALLEAIVDIKTADMFEESHDDVMRLFRSRVNASLANLRKIPKKTWDEWCEMPADELIPTLEQIYTNTFKG